MNKVYVEQLTPREIEILSLVQDGYSNQEIGALCGLSEHTIKFHLKNVYGKLGVHRRTQAVALGRMRGVLE